MGNRAKHHLLRRSSTTSASSSSTRMPVVCKARTLLREVLVALSIAAGIAALVGVYQGFVDLSFLNRPFWTYMIRAAGNSPTPTSSDRSRRSGPLERWCSSVACRVHGRSARGVCGRAPRRRRVALRITDGLAALAVSLVIAAVEGCAGGARAARALICDVSRWPAAGALVLGVD